MVRDVPAFVGERMFRVLASEYRQDLRTFGNNASKRAQASRFTPQISKHHWMGAGAFAAGTAARVAPRLAMVAAIC